MSSNKNVHLKEADRGSVTEMAPDGKVRCRICLEFNKRDYKGKWVLKASFSNHATHPIHLKAVANQNTFLTARAQELPDNYATARDMVMDSPPKDRSANDYHIGPNDEQEQAMWDDFDGNFKFEPSEADLYEQKRKEFDRRMEEYGLWGGQEALPDDDMINVEQLWQEDEQDDLLSELLEHACMCRFP